MHLCTTIVLSVVNTVGAWSIPRDSVCCALFYIAQIMSEIKLNARHCLPKNLGVYAGRSFQRKTLKFFLFQMLSLMPEGEARIDPC